MRILFVSQHFPPEMAAAGNRIYSFARHLVALGHDVDVITAFPNYPSGRVPPEYRGNLFQEEEIEGIGVHRCYIYASPRKGHLSRIANYLSFMLSSIAGTLRLDGKHDVVIATTPPLFVGLAGNLIRRLKGVPWVLDVRDILPEAWVFTGTLEENSLVVKVFELFEEFLYRKATEIVVVTETKCQRLAAKGVPTNKLHVITNGIELDRLNCEREDEGFVDEFDLGERFVVTYAGLIGASQGVGVIVEAAHHLRDLEDVLFMVVGDGIERDALIQRAEELGLSNIAFPGERPRSSIPALLKASDLCVVPLRNAEFHDVPSKLFEYLAAGCPVVLSADGEAKTVLEQASGGIAVEPGDPVALAEAIRELYAAPDLRDSYAKRGQRHVIQNYAREGLAQELESLVEDMIDRA
jgi:glycosyltransferase involved in cell wall biosynthesis